MGRILKTFLLLIFCIGISKSQCPDLPNNTTVDGSNNTSIAMCGAMSALFEVDDPNLPTGSIDWYSSTISGFDPLSSGTLLGSSAIDSADPCDAGGCPSMEAIYLNACGPGDEQLNEFVVIASGSGFLVDNLSFNFDPGNTGGSAGNGNINVGGVCTWANGDASLFTGCSSVISAGLGDYIPPNSLVIMQASSFSSSAYDISGLCGLSDCIYVISNSCDRVSAAFKNYEAANGTTRTNSIALNCGCSDQITYTVNDVGFAPFSGDGSYVLSDGTTFGNNGCNVGPSISSIPQFAYSAVTDDFNHSFTEAECNTTQYVVGVLNSTQFNTDCCSAQITNEYAFDIACITAELQGVADLCPGECEEITVLIAGGVPPYSLNLSITGLPIPFNNISLPFVGFPLDEKITICFDNGGPLFDGDNFAVDIPAIAAGFSGSLVLNTIADDNGCMGTINGSSISLSFNDDPDIFDPGDQEACDLGDGTGLFLLADMTNTINGGTAATVNYYSDPAGTMPISDPFISPPTTIYAQVLGNPCDSEIIEIDLIVISNGDAGLVTFFCTDPDTGPSTECTICDDDGILGEDVFLTIIFADPTLNYEYRVRWTSASGPSSTIDGNGIGTATVMHSIVETTIFEIEFVTPDGGCLDDTDLGDVVTINYSIQPDLVEPEDLSECGSVILPDITGNVVPSNAAYYSESGAMGTMYSPGDVIIASGTYYLYAGIEDCDVEYSFEVTIEDEAMIDDPDDVVTCGVYSVPPITGTNIDNASYYTEINGGGDVVAVGTIISTSVVLFLFDSNCGGNQPTLDITITPGPIIDNNSDTIVCEMYIVEPITGMDLSGNEMYFDTTDGNGLIINVGDTLTQDSILFIYDNTGGCEVQIPIFIDIKETGYPGLDTAIIICEGDPTLVNINEELGGDLPDSTGTWFDVNFTSIISDSSQVDFSSLAIGTYLYEYKIIDSICVDTHSILTVNIIGTPNAGNDASLTICGDTSGVDVLSLLGNPDVGGTFYDESNMVATFDPSNASFDASIIGTTNYLYVVGNPISSCGADSSTFTVIVDGSVSAGDDTSRNYCAGVIVDLTDLLMNHSGIGLFEEPSVSGGLTGNSFDTGAAGNGMYSILHIIPGMGACPSDTAIFTINVMDDVNAGNDASITICSDTSGVDVFGLLGNPDIGGTFYDESNMVATFDPSNASFDASIIGTTDYLYVVGDPLSSCGADSSIFTVVVEGSVSAGDDNARSFCAGVIINLADLLMNHSGIGAFEEPTISGGLTGNSFDTNTAGNGMYTILHILPGMGACPPDTAILTISVMDNVNAGNDASLTVCGDTTGVDVLSLLGNPDIGGTFYDESNMVATFDPSNASFDASTIGTIDYLYVVGDPLSSCGADSSIFTVIVEGNVSAGDDNARSFCAGVIIDLTDLLMNHSGIGTFEEPSVSGGLTGNSFDTEEVNDGVYIILHILPGMGTCPPDTAILTLSIMDGANAGDENEITLCGDSMVFLSTLINGDLGGQYYFNNTLLPSGDITFTNETGSLDYLYIVGDGMECPFDTAILTVHRNIKPVTLLDISLENLCNDDCTTITFNALNTGVQLIRVYYHIESNMGEVDNRVQDIGDLMPNVEITFCIGVGDLSNNELQPGTEYTFSLDSISVDNPDCVFADTLSVDFNTYASAVSTITGQRCFNDQVPVGPVDVYDIDKPGGTTIIPGGSVNGCDSVILVDLTFDLEAIDSTFILSTCDDSYSIEIGNMTFDTSMMSGVATIISSNPDACDTLVDVELTFGSLDVDYTPIDGGCTVSDSGSIIIESATGDAPFFILYNGNSVETSTLPYEIDLPIGTGEISITDNNDCEVTFTYELFSGGGDNFTIDENQGQINISGGIIDSIVWSPTEGLSCTDCSDPIAQPSQSTTYFATVFFDDSCSVELSIDIIVIDDTPDYILPSVFSPNRDNINDNFILTITQGAIGIPQSMLIYDRWGNRVYTGIGEALVTDGWNGELNGSAVISGVYVYVLTIVENEKLVTIYGDVTVVR